MACFIAVLVVSSIAAGSAISADADHSAVMRRHVGAVQLDATGEMKVISAARSTPRGKMKPDECNVNYIKGKQGTNNCTDPKTQTLIEDSWQCKEAAERACPDGTCFSANNTDFQLDMYSWEHHPWRCYQSEDKWFYNPIGYRPQNLTGNDPQGKKGGTPVCVQVEYINGTEDSNSCGPDDGEYEHIMVESVCHNAATCLSQCRPDAFRTPDAEMQNTPKGCHIVPTTGCVMFNTHTTGCTGASCSGKPLCAIKQEHTTDHNAGGS